MSAEYKPGVDGLDPCALDWYVCGLVEYIPSAKVRTMLLVLVLVLVLVLLVLVLLLLVLVLLLLLLLLLLTPQRGPRARAT